MQESEYLKASIKVAPIAMALHTGREMKIAFANDLMLSAWGKDESVFGKPFSQALPELEKFAFEAKMIEVYESGVPFSAEQIQMEYVHNDSPRTFYYSYGFNPVKDEAGKIVGILNFARDVTEQVIGREAVQQLLEKESLLEKQQLLNETLIQTQQELQELNIELETRIADRTEALTVSENRFRAVVEQAPVAIIVFRGEEMVINAVNPPMLSLLDKKKTIIGSPLLKAIPELAGQKPYELLYKVFTTGQPIYGFDTPVVLKRSEKEETGYFNFSYTPLIENGKITGVIDMATEVTEQVRARKAVQELNSDLTLANTQLAESEANLRLTIEAANLGVWFYDINTGKLHVDQRCRAFYGLPEEDEITVTDIQDAASDEYLPLLEHTLMSAIENNESCDIQYPITNRRTGEARWLRTIGKINQHSDGSPRFFGVTMDITEQKKDEQRKNDFIGMVSHELKTPLTSLGGYIQLLQLKVTKAENASEAGLLDKSYRQVKRMTTMINGFLNLSRLESGKIQVNKTTFLLDALIQEMVDEAAAFQPHYTIEFHKCSPLTVFADRDKIGNVISNLLSNAIKYSPNNKNILIACRQLDGMAQISVKDEGIGIHPEDIKKLFERYYRVKGDTSISGFGIGLYLSAEIIERHQGKIWVESEYSHGSTFYFTIPLTME